MNRDQLFQKLRKKSEKYFIQFIMDAMHIEYLEAKKTLDGLIDGLIDHTEIEFQITIPKNFGNVLLKQEKGKNVINDMLRRKRNEGVRGEDIKWWWNMPADDRLLLIMTDNFFRSILYITLRNQGFTPEEAKVKVLKKFPSYGDTGSEEKQDSEDKPLPWELKDRINIYGLNRRKSDNVQFEKDMEDSTSFNALVRMEIRRGVI